MRFLTGSQIKSFHAVKLSDNDFMKVTDDKTIISLTFEDGSIGSINYFANGGSSFPKERIEVFCDNAVLKLDNFLKLKAYDWKGFNKYNLLFQDKGQQACVNAFMSSLYEGANPPIPQNEIFEIARVSVDIAKILRN
jgi:predicted dehydrogenase